MVTSFGQAPREQWCGLWSDLNRTYFRKKKEAIKKLPYHWSMLVTGNVSIKKGRIGQYVYFFSKYFP